MTPQPNVLIIPLKVFVLNKNGESLKGLTVGTAEGTRTPNIQNRNLTLYPIELRTHIFWMPVHYNKFSAKCKEKNLKGARFYLQKIIPLFVEIWYDKQD